MYQEKKTQEKDAMSKPCKAQTKHYESCQPTPPTAQKDNGDVSKGNTAGNKKEGQIQRCSKKQRAGPAGKPPEGSNTKSQEQTK